MQYGFAFFFNGGNLSAPIFGWEKCTENIGKYKHEMATTENELPTRNDHFRALLTEREGA